MPRTALITDSTADIPPSLRQRRGIFVVPASAAFPDGMHLDGGLAPANFYARMTASQAAPPTFAPGEPAFREAFLAALDDGAEAAVCLVSPFDVSSAFTAAAAAVLNVQDERPGAVIKVINPGIASAGLCALIQVLANPAQSCDAAALSDLIDELEPSCDTLFVPAETTWLERTGRLALIEDRLGPLQGRTPVVRIGTRISAVSAQVTHEAAISDLIATVGLRAGAEMPLAMVVDHADAAGLAEVVAARLKERWSVASLTITELSPTIGSQLGPGAIGVGVCPAGGTSA